MSKLLNNTTSLQEILETVNNLPNANGGEQADPVITIKDNGLITAIAGTKSTTYQMAFQPAKTITPNTTTQVAVSSGHYTGGDIVVAGDSNLVAENIKSGVSIFGVSGTLEENGGSAAEWSENEDDIITGEVVSYTNDRVIKVRETAFVATQITSANFPNCIEIGGRTIQGGVRIGAFAYCSNLIEVSFPSCTDIGAYTFYGCNKLTTVYFPACTNIEKYAFNDCNKLTTVSFPTCTNIGESCFERSYSLTTVSFPACTNISSHAFVNCSNLITAYFPACTNIREYAFNYCGKLTMADFPVCTSIGGYAFGDCSSLTKAYFSSCANIGSNALIRCYCLSELLLKTSSVCTLAHSNAFSSTPFAGYSSYFSGTPHIYVPASLVDAYKSATNWVYFSSYIAAIESTEVLPEEPEEPTDNLITFIIGDTQYQAEEGMAWSEWIESNYNVDGYYIDLTLLSILSPDGKTVSSGIKPVMNSALIQAGQTYGLR